MKALPERIRISLVDDPRGARPLPLPPHRLWPAGIVFGVLFVFFAGIAVGQIGAIEGWEVETVFDLTGLLFQIFWVLAWSVGVLILFLITVLLLTYRESVRIRGGRLLYVPRLGPLKIIAEYDLAKIRNLRAAAAGKHDRVTIRFDYGGGEMSLGNPMPRAEAEPRIQTIERAIQEGHASDREAPAAGSPRDEPPALYLTRWLTRRFSRRPRRAAHLKPSDSQRAEEPLRSSAPSSVALLAANAIPLAGILVLGWDLGEIMVLFWAENAVIGLYTLLRLAVVAKGWVVLLGPFFIGHFGGFMAVHFMFIYYLFVQDTVLVGPEPELWQTLSDLFIPLWPALLALFVSHGVSFYGNFLRRREYEGRRVSEQMGEPYKRVVLLHVTIIFGGWIILLLGKPVAALILLIALKTAVDLRAHRKEHAS